MTLYKPSSLFNFLSELKIKPKKSLSQNFLIDKNTVDKIVSSSNIQKEDIILEIGPGPGVLTNIILEKCKKLIAIEKDRTFAKALSKNKKLEIKNLDFLDLDLSFLKEFNKKIKVISSIPYHLTSPIISKLLENHFLFSSITLMIQKEVAQRIASSPNCKKYSSFSIFVNFYADVKIVSYVSKNCFLPKPKVDSAIIKLDLKTTLEEIPKEDFHKMVRASFSQRRKKLLTCLKPLYPIEDLKKAFIELKISENVRAENLSLNDYLALFKRLNS